MASPRNVAVLRALGLGDMLCAVPMLRALRGLWPEAMVTLIGLPWARHLADRFPRYLDAFLEFPGWPGLPERRADERRITRFLRQARERGFDLVLQAQGSGLITNELVATLGARRAGGFHPPESRPPGPGWISYPTDRREPLRLLALAEHLGARDLDPELAFPLAQRDRDEAAEVRLTLGLGERPYACVHTGSSTSARRWSASGFGQVIDELDRSGLAVVLTGTAGERGAAGRAAAAAQHTPYSAVGRTSLGGLAALLAGSRMLVTNDTGVSHLAAALRVPSVVVFTGSDPARWAPIASERHIAVGEGCSEAPPREAARRDSAGPVRGRIVPRVDEVLRAVRYQMLRTAAGSA